MVSNVRNRKTRTEALRLGVLIRLDVVRLELAKERGNNVSRLPSYSDAVGYLLDREGF